MKLAVVYLGVLVACSPQPRPSPAGEGVVGETARENRFAVVPAADSIPDGSSRVLTNTMYVEDLALVHDVLWVATRGGVERYVGDDHSNRRVFTTLDGLDSNHVWQIGVKGGGIVARTRDSACTLSNERFHCTAAAALPTPQPVVSAPFEGRRVTARAGRFVGTAGAGVWLDSTRPRQLTPTDQICSNHFMAIAEWKGQVWLGAFDDGLCVTSDFRSFETIDAPFRMVNDLAVTPRGLYVAAAAGLFRSTDGKTFERVDFVDRRGVNGLAFDGKSLWVTTPGALWRVRVNGGPPSRTYWRPGGTRSLQGVAAGVHGVWLASEDKGAIHKQRRGFEVFDRVSGAPTSWSLAVAVDDSGNAFVATLRHGLLRIDRRGRVRTIKGVPDEWLLDVRVLDGQVFVGTQGGAARIDDSGAIQPIADLPHPNVHAFYVGRGGTWVATEGGTLVRGHAPVSNSLEITPDFGGGA